MMPTILRILLIAAAMAALAGCAEEGPAERAGARLDDAIDGARDRFEDVRDEVEDAADDVREALEGEE